MPILCRLIGHRPAPGVEVCTLVSRRLHVRQMYRRWCVRCTVFSSWSQERTPVWNASRALDSFLKAIAPLQQ